MIIPKGTEFRACRHDGRGILLFNDSIYNHPVILDCCKICLPAFEEMGFKDLQITQKSKS